MSITNRKGNVFLIDLSFSFLFLCFFVFLIISFIFPYAKTLNGLVEEFEEKRHALIVLDSLIKNFDENSSFKGSAFLNSELKRVESNVIDLKKLKKIEGEKIDENIREIFFEWGEKKEFLVKKEVKGNCFSLKRMVFLKDSGLKKGFVGVRYCYQLMLCLVLLFYCSLFFPLV